VHLGCDIVSRYLFPLALLLAFIAFMPRGAHAQQPVTAYTYQVSGIKTSTLPGGPFSSAAAACAAWVQEWNSDPNYSGYQQQGAATLTASTETSCDVKHVVGNSVPSITRSISGTTCPGGSLASGSTCICPVGTTWNGSTCAGASGGGGGTGTCGSISGVHHRIEGDVPHTMQSICTDGVGESMQGVKCKARVGSGICLSGGKYCATEIVFTSESCTEPPPVVTGAQPSPCASGQVPLEINGQVQCVLGGSPGTNPTRVQRTETVNADGSRTVTITNASFSGESSSYEKKTTAYDSGGVATGTSTETGSGTGGAGGVGSGSGGGGEGDKGTELGTPGGGPNLATVDKGPQSITAVGGMGAGSCPADIPLPKGMSFSFSGICQAADALRPVVIALAWLSAGLIFLGGLKRD
jgi:hypothetical protein